AVSATDLVDGSRPVTCVPSSGSTFVVGATTVNCTASDTRGNSGSGSFTVTITLVDTTAPATSVAAQPGGQEATGAAAPVAYSVTVTDDTDASPVLTCVPASGSGFAVGDTTVTCNAHDAAGNNAAAKSFTVRVTDTTAPAFGNVPQDMTVQATSGAGAVVT